MIIYTSGDMFKIKVDAVVNTVNTQGISGKGIALYFKKRFPRNYKLYRELCKGTGMEPGTILVTDCGEGVYKWIVNLSTKDAWYYPSKEEWIIRSLFQLRDWLTDNKIESIAIPPLGCANGGLAWVAVKYHIGKILSNLETKIYIFEP